MRVNWMQTFSGQALDPLNPDPLKMRVEDIPHGLALSNRFAGQTFAPYSVAQHCVLGSRLIAPEFAFAFLMHELDEVYLTDIVTQVKRVLHVPTGSADYDDQFRSFDELAEKHEDALLKLLGLPTLKPLLHSPEVKQMDLAMLAWERRDLMGPSPKPWGIGVKPPAGVGKLAAWPWYHAETEFRERFNELYVPAQYTALVTL